MTKPRIAITMGDPTGIGPETIVGAWADGRIHDCCRPMAVGHPEILRRAVELLGVDLEVVDISVNELADMADSARAVIPCLRSGSDNVLDAPVAKIDARGGQAAFDALQLATELALSGKVEAITTAPLNKAALWEAGHRYPGHTELLGEFCAASEVAMMLYLSPQASGPQAIAGRSKGLGVVHVTLHTAMRNVFSQITEEAIIAKAHLIGEVMGRLNGSSPRIGVCALNPHAGEQGLFGDEEQTIITPAVQRAASEGLSISGPLPADTLMVRAAGGEFDAVVAMYHDQGHIALKLLGLFDAVNITLGLPIIRTSVAHGTAYDLAWQGRAESRSMVEAVCTAARMAGSLACVSRQ